MLANIKQIIKNRSVIYVRQNMPAIAAAHDVCKNLILKYFTKQRFRSPVVYIIFYEHWLLLTPPKEFRVLVYEIYLNIILGSFLLKLDSGKCIQTNVRFGKMYSEKWKFGNMIDYLHAQLLKWIQFSEILKKKHLIVCSSLKNSKAPLTCLKKY